MTPTQPPGLRADEREALEADSYAQVEDRIKKRYRVEPTGRGFWPYCVRAGNGTRELFVGHKRKCDEVAAALTTACLDGAFMLAHARAALTTQPATQPAEPSEVRDAERIQHFEDMANCGYCPTLVFDDDGRWAVSYSGAAPVPEPEGHQETVFITVEVEPDLWRHSVREAIDAAIQAQHGAGKAGK